MVNNLSDISLNIVRYGFERVRQEIGLARLRCRYGIGLVTRERRLAVDSYSDFKAERLFSKLLELQAKGDKVAETRLITLPTLSKDYAVTLRKNGHYESGGNDWVVSTVKVINRLCKEFNVS